MSRQYAVANTTDIAGSAGHHVPGHPAMKISNTLEPLENAHNLPRISGDAMVGISPYLIAASKGALSLPRAVRCTEKQMNTGIGRAQLGQWYRHLDTREIFRVVGLDTESRSIVIQSVDGDLDEIDEESWVTLPLGWAEPPEDFTDTLIVDINGEYAKLFD
jgi:hypothetical protein